MLRCHLPLTFSTSRDGELYSMGNAEQGQLGRVMEKFAHRGGRRGLETFLR